MISHYDVVTDLLSRLLVDVILEFAKPESSTTNNMKRGARHLIIAAGAGYDGYLDTIKARENAVRQDIMRMDVAA